MLTGIEYRDNLVTKIMEEFYCLEKQITTKEILGEERDKATFRQQILGEFHDFIHSVSVMTLKRGEVKNESD
jgi:hypothetical protein